MRQYPQMTPFFGTSRQWTDGGFADAPLVRLDEVMAKPSRSGDILSLSSFVVLGLPDGMLGTAWPSMRGTFGAPVGELGLILLLATAGSVLVTAFVGRLILRLGVPALLAAAGLTAGAGYAGLAGAPGGWAGGGEGGGRGSAVREGGKGRGRALPLGLVFGGLRRNLFARPGRVARHGHE